MKEAKATIPIVAVKIAQTMLYHVTSVNSRMVGFNVKTNGNKSAAESYLNP